MAIGTEYENRTKRGPQPLNLPVGTAIALVGMWVAATALTCFLFAGIWLWMMPSVELDDSTAGNIMIPLILAGLVWLNCAPMIGAFKFTRILLGRSE